MARSTVCVSSSLRAEEDEGESGDQNLHVYNELVDAGRLESARRLRNDDGVRLGTLDLVSPALDQTLLEVFFI